MLTGRLVLVVEDEAMIAMLVEAALVEAGAKVALAASVDEALELIGNRRLDLAVLDCKLGEEPVTPVADRLAGLGVPIIFATGYGEDYDRGQHSNAPIFTKPFAPEELVHTIDNLLRR